MLKKSLGILFLVIFSFSFVSAALTIDITYPVHGANYDSKINRIDWTATDITNTSVCWYEKEDAVKHPIECGAGTINVADSEEEGNTWRIYINDTTEEHNDFSTFWVDSIAPDILVTNPADHPLSYTKENFFNILSLLIEQNPGLYTKGIVTGAMKFNFWDPGVDPETENPNYWTVSSNSVTYSPFDPMDGAYHYSINAKDIYPNGTTIREVSENGIIIRDTVIPTIFDDYAYDGVWINEDQTVTLTAEDPEPASGINNVKYCQDIDNTCNPAAGTEVISPYILTHFEEGNYSIRYQTWDNAGNPSDPVGNYNVLLDKTPPVTTDDAPGIWINSDITVALDASDELSGVDETLFCVDHENVCAPDTSYGEGDVYISDEGINYLRHYSTDIAGNSEGEKSTEVKIDLSAPISEITAPDASSWHNNDFSVSRTDFDAFSGINEEACQIQICRFDGEGNICTGWMATNCNEDYLIPVLGEAVCTNEGADACIVNIMLADNVGWISGEYSRAFSIDLTAPVTTAESNPLTGDWTNQDTEVTLTCDDGEGTSGCENTYYCTYNSDLEEDCSDYSTYNSIITISQEGTTILKYYSADNAGNEGEANYETIQIDKSGPIIEITEPSPENNHAFNLGTSFDFHIEDSDFSGTDNCVLTINGNDYSMFQAESWDYFFGPEEAGLYTWFVTCLDILGNPNISETRTFTILSELENEADFDEFTNLTEENDISSVFPFFVGNAFGSINWTEPIDFSSGFDWTILVSITKNLISVDSTTPELNKSAEITIYNISFTNSDYINILRDGVKCTEPVCNILGYDSDTKTLIFNVTGFTNYSAEQGMYCGDGSCNNQEDCSSCSQDCGTCSTGSPSGGGGSCTTTWSCTEWSECVDSQQTRTCTKKVSYCEAPAKPAETQTCTILSSQPEAGELEQEIGTTEEDRGVLAGITGAIIGTAVGRTITGIVIFVIILIIIYLIAKFKEKPSLKGLKYNTKNESDNPVTGKKTNPILNKLRGKEVNESKPHIRNIREM